jgi:hypothetical protein
MPASAAKRRITRETVTEIEGEAADETEGAEEGEDLHPEAPMFSPLLRRAKRIETVTVKRTDPEDTTRWTYLGTISPEMTEATLKAKWGGGNYRIEAKNAAGQIVADGVRVCRLSGDPIFESEVDERRWRKANGLADKTTTPALSIKDLLFLLDEKEEKRRQEQIAREDRARKEQTEREDRERLAREERDARNQKEADEREERRRRQALEDDERRTRAHREDMERLTASNAQAMAQTQQFYQQLATSLKADVNTSAAADPVKNLLAGMQIAREMGGGGGDGAPADLLTTVMGRLPETLAEVRKTASAVAVEMKGGKRPHQVPAGQDYLTITGPTATKAKQVITLLAKAGKDPEAELNRLLSFAAAAAGQAAAPPKRTAPAAPTTTKRRRPPPPAHRKRRPN